MIEKAVNTMIQHFLDKPILSMLYPMYATVVASTLAFDVDIKTVISVVTLVVSQLYLIIKWGVKIEAEQKSLGVKLANIEVKLDQSKTTEDIAALVRESIQMGISEVLDAQVKLNGAIASATSRGL